MSYSVQASVDLMISLSAVRKVHEFLTPKLAVEERQFLETLTSAANFETSFFSETFANLSIFSASPCPILAV